MENQDEYNEEVRREVVAEAFEPVLDDILDSQDKTNTDDNTDGWPKIWSPISPLKAKYSPLKLKFTRLTHPKPKYGSPSHSKAHDKALGFQEPVDLKASLHNFRVYVNDTEYFMSNLPHVYAKWSLEKDLGVNDVHDIRKTNFNYKTEPYFAMICGAYIASHLSGISLLNLFDNVSSGFANNTAGNLISSFVRYHFYYQIRKFMQHPKLIHQYDVSGVKKHIPYKIVERESKGTDGDGNTFVYMTYIEHSGTDYRSFIAYQSEGLTPIGQKLFQESLESFNYSILGAEARTRWSIVGKGAKSSQTQDVFRKIVEDTIIQNNSTVLISNMRKSIQATNVVLNLAVVPNVILMPSNFVILSKKIRGYNNVLTTATEDMTFGVNKNVNYVRYNKPQDSPAAQDTQNSTSRNTSHGNDSGDGGGDAFNERGISRSDVNINTSAYNYNPKSTSSSSQLPLTFFISLAVGLGVSAAFSAM